MRRCDQRAPDEIFRACRTFLGENLWKRIIALHGSADAADRICETLRSAHRAFAVPPFLPDLARLEKAIEDVTSVDVIIPENPAQVTLNPTVTLVDLSWKHLLPFVEPAHGEERPAPEPGEEIFLLWKDPATGQLRIGPAGQDDLLALKIVVEDLNPCTLAKDEGLPVSSIDALLNRASHKGILIKPGSQIRRDQTFPSGAHIDAQYFSSQTFTLQWHITQACDLHCRHGCFGLKPGQWTDDTSMALCLAESLIETNQFDPGDQMQRYVRWWRKGHLSVTSKCFDIGNTTRTALAEFEKTGNPYCGSTASTSAGNGSLMRLAPIRCFSFSLRRSWRPPPPIALEPHMPLPRR